MKKQMKESYKFLLVVAIFFIFYFFPLTIIPFRNPVFEGLALVKDYARQHVLLCLVPAFFIAGAITIFISQNAVLKYLGPDANKILAYGIASISGTILAVCSCTVLPIFAGIYRSGAGLGPATSFLYSGPAINIMAIVLTAKVLGWQLGLARAIGAVIFSIVVGILMHLIFLKESRNTKGGMHITSTGDKEPRSIKQDSIYLFTMVAILVFANWAKPQSNETGFFVFIFRIKWILTSIFCIVLMYILKRWFSKEELKEWVNATWIFAKQILPLLLIGVFIAGFLLGRPGYEGLIPSGFVTKLVGGNSIFANFFAAIVGAFMYFATLTEVPILQGLIGSGMGKGPALALLLAGPALSLPNMLVLKSIMGIKKTAVYVTLVVIIATITGIIFGLIYN